MIESDKLEIPISLISQYLYCKRRAALIALYGEWGDNDHTILGTLEHERVHEEAVFSNGSYKTFHGLHVKSELLSLSGICDRVDYETETGRYIPIEFKHGKRRKAVETATQREYEAQLCAQVMCIEESSNCKIDVGYLFFITEGRRKEIAITEDLRAVTLQTIEELRNMISSKNLPAAQYTPKCRECSLIEICLPKSPNNARASVFVSRVLAFAQGGDET